MVLAEFSMFPTDKGESVSKYVSQIIDLIDKSGIEYRLTPMGTVIEGTPEEVFGLIQACLKTLEPHCNRIYSNIKIDYRKGSDSRMRTKIAKVESLLNREIKHS